MNSPAAVFRANIERRLRDLRLSRSEFARQVGITPQLVTRILGQGYDNPGLELIAKIAKALGVEVWQLLQPPSEAKVARPKPTIIEAALRMREFYDDLEKGNLEAARDLLEELKRRNAKD